MTPMTHPDASAQSPPCREVRWICMAHAVRGAVILVVMAVTGSGVAAGIRTGPPKIAVPEMAEKPILDGRIGESEWRDAVESYGFVNCVVPKRVNEREGRFWVGYKNASLYLAVRTEVPVEEGILNRARPQAGADSPAVFFDDSIEIVLSPNHDSKAQALYHLTFNASGALDDWVQDPAGKPNERAEWRIPKWSMRNSVHDGWWDVEVEIPFASVGAQDATGAAPWALSIARNWKRPFAQSRWSSEDGRDPSTLPVVTWDRTAPVVQVLSLSERASPAIRVLVRNPHPFELGFTALISDEWRENRSERLNKSVKLPPGAQTVLELRSSDAGPLNDHRTSISIESADGERSYYYRDYSWNLHRAPDAWDVARRQAKKVVLQFKYYPYLNKIRVWLNTRGLSRSDVTGATLQILKSEKSVASGWPPVWRGRIQIKHGLGETIASIPDLPDGDYRLSVTLHGAKSSMEPLVRAFARKHFEWERNRLGVSGQVIPPFRPLRVHGTTVSSVLRNHVHAPTGLWQQVSSDGKDLLTGPMRFEVQFEDGATAEAVGSGWHASSQRDTEVVSESTWKADVLHARLVSTYDYDGMMKSKLTLNRCNRRVKSVVLKIPLFDERAKFMHACGDGLRHNYAGRVPAGSGLVWDSSRAGKLDILGTFFPYIWLGDGERGLAWFADTDRGWILDEKTPAIDLVRTDATLWLNVHFVTRSSVLEHDHEIVFGLQATPTKPMPDGWRRWTLRKAITGGRPVDFLGASYYWGAEEFLPYPLDKDFSYFERMKLLREGDAQGSQGRGFINDWMDKVAKYAPRGSDAYATIERHVVAGMGIAAARGWNEGFRLLGYTNPRGISFLADEFAYFQDEWLNYDYFTRDWDRRQSVAYDVTPAQSMIDCLVWYYRKMLVALDGVYWDNLFLAARNDPVVGDGTWIDGTNRVHPALGLFALRELVKRSAVMLHEEARKVSKRRTPFVSMGHMTNANLVPILSFLNATLDWEWKYGGDDFQDRFSADFTVAETIGRQVGAWPTVLNGGAWSQRDRNAQREWLDRNRLAVSLVHELWPADDYLPQFVVDIYARLFAFGYGTSACRVFNYWQDENPVVVSGEAVIGKTLVISKPGAAIIVVSDYGNGGSCRVKVNLTRLGLPPDVHASNFETGEAIEQVATGEYRLTVPRHDMRILLVRQTDVPE